MPNAKSEKILGPVVVSGGDIVRLMKDPNGSVRPEIWAKGVGWTPANGSVRPDELMPGATRPASPNDAALAGMPISEI
jgi:hypothetical protein